MEPFILVLSTASDQEKLIHMIKDGWVQDPHFNQGKALELPGYETVELSMPPGLVYHLVKYTPEEMLNMAPAKREEKGPIVEFENVLSEKIGEYIKNGWEFMDEKNLVWQKNAHMVKRGKLGQPAASPAPVQTPIEAPAAVPMGPGGSVEVPVLTKEFTLNAADVEHAKNNDFPPVSVGPLSLDQMGKAAGSETKTAQTQIGKKGLMGPTEIRATMESIAARTMDPTKPLSAEDQAFKAKYPKVFEAVEARLKSLRGITGPELFSPNAETQSEDRKA